MSRDTEYYCACKGMMTTSTDECAYCTYREPRIMQVPMGRKSGVESAGSGDPQADVRTPSGPTCNGRSAGEERAEQSILRGEEGCSTLRGGAARTAGDTTVSCGKCGNDTGQCNCYLEDL